MMALLFVQQVEAFVRPVKAFFLGVEHSTVWALQTVAANTVAKRIVRFIY